VSEPVARPQLHPQPPLPRIRRLVGLTSILVDVAVTVPGLPPRGGDVVAKPTSRAPGGGINALAAAARLDMPVVYAGAHGTGVNGQAVREALAAEHIGVISRPDPVDDTGWCLAMVEPDGERTFVTVPGAEAALGLGDLRALQAQLTSTDALYVSGYDLAYEGSGHALATWLAPLLPHDEGGPYVVLDPGPLVADIPVDRLRAALSRTDLVSASAPELGAIEALAPGAVNPSAVVLRRYGPAPVELRWDDVSTGTRQTLVVPTTPPPGRVVDTNGAGDTHLGALLAALAADGDWTTAIGIANQAAAWSLTRRGAATGPTSAELDAVTPRV
jgi:sugar/nucleoside kinase (ribokinase family)